MAYESESLVGGNGNPNNVASAANLINAGDWVTGALSSANDVDYFKFTASAGLLTLQFKSSLLSGTARWKADLLDANGDFLRTLTSSASGTLLAKQGTSTTQVIVSGLTANLTSGSQFTLNSSAADTTIYTVLSVDGKSGDTNTITVDKAFTSTTNVSVLFDPAQMLATGNLTALQALIPQDGTYYLKVSPLAWTDADYAVQVNLQGSAETLNNGSITDARDDNSRLLAGVSHQGQISTANDTDVWLLTTAKASTFTINFAADTNSSKTKFHVDISVWTKDANGNDVLTPAKAAGGVALNSQVEGQLSFTIDATVYPQTNTFVVTVTADSLSAGTATGGYSLKASGTGLDLNDNPIIQIGSYSSSKPLDLLDLTLNDKAVHTYAKDSGATVHKVALSTLFTATDPDGQALSYKVWLDAATDSNAAGSIKLEPAGSASSTYTNGGLMTAAQLQTAYVYTGSVVGDLTLKVMAFDSTNAPDNSGVSSQVLQTLRVVSDAVGVNVVTDSSLSLVEGATSSDVGYQESISISLKTQPTADVEVNLVDSSNQFLLSARKLTFTAANYATEQTVTVRANNDGKVEGSDVASSLSFTVVSDDTSYNGSTISPLSIAITDPSNQAPTGSVTLPTADVTQGTSITASNDLVDADGLGSLLYVWQRSTDNGANWTDIAGSATATYKPMLADAGALLHVKVSYYDGLGKLESVTSNATNAVIKTNSAPTTTDASLAMAKTAAHTFAAADFPFADVDNGDALSAVVIYNLPDKGQLKFNDASFVVGDGFKILLSELSQLVYTPSASQTDTYADSISFSVVDSKDETSVAKTMTLEVSTPPASSNITLTGTEDTALPISLANFAFTDADTSDAIQSVTITALPTDGQLRLGNSAVTLNQVISAADITANKLVFTPAANANGDAYASLKFKVFDGTVTSASDYTMTFKIAAVDDAPTFAGVPTAVLSHSAGQVFSLDDVTVADVDTNNLSLSLVVTNGDVLGLTDEDTNTAGIQLSGTAAKINAALKQANFVGKVAGDAGIALTLKDATTTVTGNYPLTMTSAASASDTDGDGLSNSSEKGDANADGIPDQYQSNVASTDKLTLVAQSDQGIPPVDAETKITSLTNVTDLGSLHPPVGMTEPGGVLSFNAAVTAGKEEHFSVLVANSLAVNGYWQQNSDGVWVNLASKINGGSVTQVGDNTRIDFVVKDGGAFDADHAANGVIQDTGLVGHLNAGLVGVPTDMPSDGFWF